MQAELTLGYINEGSVPICLPLRTKEFGGELDTSIMQDCKEK
jgi:hypothetical protein